MPKKQEKPTKEEPKEKNLESLSQTHGKDEEKNTPIPSTLDQVWGDDGSWKYSTMNVKEYQDQLNLMAKVDIQNHSIKIGIIPIDNRAMLTQRLVREFRNHVSKYRANAVPLQAGESNKEELSDEIKQILEEGR